MSFSSNVKDEILEKASKNKLRKSEKFGELLAESTLKSDLKDEYSEFFDIAKLSEEDIKEILKGVFLSSGYIVDPISDYHLEIDIKNKACAEYIFNILSVLEFTPKLIKRKKINMYIIYFKESEQISFFLQLIGANRAYLKFEEILVEKEVRNNINRAVNCEAANIQKTVKSSMEQIEAIEKIKRKGKFDELPEKLKNTASLRLKYKNESLESLSNITKSQNCYVSKSGLKHRLDKLIEIANKL